MRSIGTLLAVTIPLFATSARADGTKTAKNLGMSEEELRAAKSFDVEQARPSVVATTDETKKEEPPAEVKSAEPYRSIVRFGAGPAMFFSKADFGAGLGLVVDFGTGAAGFRLASTWVRSLKQGPLEDASVTGSGFGQYTGEITLDLLKRGPLHPVFGVGFGMLQVYGKDDYFAGVGTGRIGLQYAIRIDGADVRLGADVTGVLLGPAPHALSDLAGYAIANASIAIGF